MNTTTRLIRPLVIALITVVAAVVLFWVLFAPTSTTWRLSAAELQVWQEGCPTADACGEPESVENGLECWTVGRVTACRPAGA
jgi:hypothetical protein